MAQAVNQLSHAASPPPGRPVAHPARGSLGPRQVICIDQPQELTWEEIKSIGLGFVGRLVGGTILTILSVVAGGGPLLATGNSVIGYRFMPSVGKPSDITRFTTGQIGEADCIGFFFPFAMGMSTNHLYSSDSWSKAAPLLGKAALVGLASSAAGALIIALFKSGESNRQREESLIAMSEYRVRMHQAQRGAARV